MASIHLETDIDRALALRPGVPLALFERAFVNDARGDWEAEGHDLVDGMRVEARMQSRACSSLAQCEGSCPRV